MHPTRRTIAIVAAGFGLAVLPAAVHPGLWVLWAGCWGVLAGLAGLDVARSPDVGDIRCELATPDTLHTGREATGRLTVRLPEAPPVRLRLTVDASAPLEAPPVIRRTAVEGALEVSLPLVATRRGTAR